MTAVIKRDHAYFLSIKPYAHSRARVTFFSEDHGLVEIWVSGVSRFNKQGLLSRPFIGLDLSFTDQGRKKLVTCEGMQYHELQGKKMLCGLYLNELIAKTLRPNDAHPEIFVAYQQVLAYWQDEDELQVPLRCFEHQLLVAIGHGIPYQQLPSAAYVSLDQERGLIAVERDHPWAVPSAGVRLMAQGDFSDAVTARQLHRLAIRYAIAPHTLTSWGLFARKS